MSINPLENFVGKIPCELRTDALTRRLYATDASIYQVGPLGVAFPRTAHEAAAAVKAAATEGIAVTPRSAGTGLTGGALGSGLVIDFGRYNREITAFNREARTVRVGAGVVLDQLNAYLQPHGLTFGPDVATSSRAMLGGMIGNNSSGARARIYGTTIDHVRSLEAVLADGSVVELGEGRNPLAETAKQADALVNACAEEVRERFHQRICKRWPGYGLDRYLRAPGNLSKLIGGSEGTLAGVFSAELNLVPLPKSKGVGLIFFASVAEAMQATVELLELDPAGIEHIDDVLFDQTRGQLAFRTVRGFLELDEKPCKSILLVEFYEDERDKLAAFEKKRLGLRKYVCKSAAEMAEVWNLRKAGLSLLTGCKGPAKPTPGVEDVAVPPAQLPEYIQGVEALMKSLGFRASYYGHAATGLVHVRPVVDLHQARDIARFRRLAEGISDLARQFGGSLTAEHGVGIARTEFIAAQVGPRLLETMRGIKQLFDPRNLLNPGKIFDDGTFRFDTQLRQGPGAHIDLPFEPVLAFAAKDESFAGNLEQCNGCGGCRKDAPTMCPTFIATGDEIMSTRGRANVIRAVLERHLDPEIPAVLSGDLDMAISNCLACKACTAECPSNVNLALLKAELLYARMKKTGVPLGVRVISRIDLLGAVASRMPRLVNASLTWSWFRKLLEKALGISARRPLPEYAPEPFDRWFRRCAPAKGARGRVILWDDCFVRYNEPQIGRAAVRVLEAAGFEVTLLPGRACCGRPAFSMGRLDVAARFGRHNLALLKGNRDPIVFLEPSCFAMFREDYQELKLSGADEIAERAVLFEGFMETALAENPNLPAFDPTPRRTAIHAHCHAKALTDTAVMPRLAARIPNNTVEFLDTGCCGMAGAFGALEAKYDLSVKVAQPLVDKINALAPGTRLVASGTSCRHQITHLTAARPVHLAELLAEALVEPRG